jgi:hypothetical protein
MLAPCSPTVAHGGAEFSVNPFLSFHGSIVMYNVLYDYIATKTAAANARKPANAAIATAGTHDLPEACDKQAIHKAFTSLARANKKAVAIVDGLDGAAIFAEAETARIEKRKAKMIAEAEALENAINSRLDEIMADDSRRAMLIAEANAAAELAAQAGQASDVEYVA